MNSDALHRLSSMTEALTRKNAAVIPCQNLKDGPLEMLMKSILRFLGLAPTQRDREIAEMVKKSYKSVRVVGRGTIKIDAKEVFDSPEFQWAQKRAQDIVDSERRR